MRGATQTTTIQRGRKVESDMPDNPAGKQQSDGEPTQFDNPAEIARKVFAAPRADVEEAIDAEKAKRMKSRLRRKKNQYGLTRA